MTLMAKIPGVKFGFEYKYADVDFQNRKITFVLENDEKIEFEMLEGEEYTDSFERISKLTNPEQPNDNIILFDKKIAKKTINNIEDQKILLDIFCRGALFTADRIKKTSKIYKEFIANKNTVKMENSFYIIELKGYILTTQHKKLLLTSLSNAKKIEVGAEGRVIVHTTTRSLAIQAGFCTRTSYGKDKKEYVIELMKELRSATISIKNKSTNEEITFGFVDEIHRNNDDFIITFSKVFSKKIHEEHLSFLPKNLDFTLPALIFDTILYFTTQTAHKSNKKISFKKLIQIMHNNERYRLQDYKQMLKEYETILQKHNILADFENEILEYKPHSDFDK